MIFKGNLHSFSSKYKDLSIILMAGGIILMAGGVQTIYSLDKQTYSLVL